MLVNHQRFDLFGLNLSLTRHQLTFKTQVVFFLIAFFFVVKKAPGKVEQQYFGNISISLSVAFVEM